MKKLLFGFLSAFLLISCNDGDIITEELDFEDTFLACGELVFYKIKEDPAESLSLQITSEELSLADLLIQTDGVLETTEEEFSINGTTNTFNYRRYNTTPTDFFCNDVPSSDITITHDEESTTGTATVYIALIEDDNDGIEADLEDINGNGDLTDDDTDGDGLPNYLDEDDDGDNVLTRLEIDTEDEDGDDDPTTNALDTDIDGIPDYLDTDDDNDGVATIDEENDSQDEDPSNDFTSTNPAITVADFLNAEVANTVLATAYKDHDIQQTFEVTVEITSLELPSNVTFDYLDFGTLEDDSLIDERTVEIPF
ncbi:hypothetical protein Q4512_11355 [Oceanihabitans sp. 2_MG-2023]|uniref:hypothetical protein n=1 Tax=Oceanihabitans sp. 2_MG-2023 TaxID=3062661 RepID=UPI0026E20D86|nr:hypothetical protein [Oceanihabitans sp. 2_MG-2023]MDO6597514.1 hypothetical protein [Oceanihabitans sp. 2_MG-2023]